MMQPPTPASAHCSTTPSTMSAGTASTAQSTGPGTSPIEAKHSTPWIVPPLGFTPNTRPVKRTMFAAVRAPNDFSFRESPTIATVSGAISRFICVCV
jgi:hypothetical protein